MAPQRSQDLRMKPLTGRQREVVLEILNSIIERGYPPTLRELAVSLGVKQTEGVRGHLRALVTKQWIEIDSKHSRGIKSVHPSMRACIATGFLQGLRRELPEIGPMVDVLEDRFLEVFDGFR